MEMLVYYLQTDQEKKLKGSYKFDYQFNESNLQTIVYICIYRYFRNYEREDFGKAGTTPQIDVVLEPGPLPFNVSTLDQYRKLGLVVEVDNGVMKLREQYIAAQVGVPLTPEQAKILVHLGRKVDTFKINLLAIWHEGRFEEYSS